VQDVLGDDTGVTGLRIEATEGGRDQDIKVAGVFIAVGHTPNTEIFAGQLEMKGGYIVVRSGIEATRRRRACRACLRPADVADHVYRQAVTSAGTGCMAALDAEQYLEQLDAAH